MLNNKQQSIVQFPLSPLAKAGVFIVNMQNEEIEEHDVKQPHRDNHYLLMLATNGKFKLNIDFEEIEFVAPALLCVFPEQVHNIIDAIKPEGWIISFDSSLVDKELLEPIESKITAPISLKHMIDLLYQTTTLMDLIEKLQNKNITIYTYITIHCLLNGLLGLIVGNVATNKAIPKQKKRRGMVIKEAFNKLLKKHFKTWKQPVQYAAALHISVAHLNDTVKELTGIPVSVHIQQASILAAKRLLYFTDNSVKEIAYEIGHDDPIYFGKLFKKITEFTPLEFRKKYRD